MFRLEGIDHVAIAVSDTDRSVTWYAEVLGLERRFEDAWPDAPYMMCAGSTCVAIFPVEGSAHAPPGPDTIAMRHFAFAIDRTNFDRARQELAARGIETKFSDHGVSHSIYLDDPDGHTIELTTYEI